MTHQWIMAGVFPLYTHGFYPTLPPKNTMVLAFNSGAKPCASRVSCKRSKAVASS